MTAAETSNYCLQTGTILPGTTTTHCSMRLCAARLRFALNIAVSRRVASGAWQAPNFVWIRRCAFLRGRILLQQACSFAATATRRFEAFCRNLQPRLELIFKVLRLPVFNLYAR